MMGEWFSVFAYYYRGHCSIPNNNSVISGADPVSKYGQALQIIGCE
jgi:hypothetical protein